MSGTKSQGWLVRVPGVFAEWTPEIFRGWGAAGVKAMSGEYFLVRDVDFADLRKGAFGKFARWTLPLDHAWPCQPEKMEGFVEKAAQGLAKKFGGEAVQAILAGPLDGGNRYFKTLASNVRGRLLQVFPQREGGFVAAEAQDPEKRSLFCLVGKEGLFAGIFSPREANGFYPGGTKFIRQGAEATISRAGAKIAEALHYLGLYQISPGEGAAWLELGASPGGMTSELLARGYRVTAVDRAVLDRRLDGAERLEFVKRDVAAFLPGRDRYFDALLSDMNGDPRDAMRQVARLSGNLTNGGLVVFTLKTTGSRSIDEVNQSCDEMVATASKAGLKLVAVTHLTYNRQEFTAFFRRMSD